MEEGRLTEKSTEDALATLTAVTAASVAHATKVLPRAPAGWLVAGGGTRNPTLMRMLAQRLAPGQHRDGRRGRLVGRCAGGAGLRLSRRANA
jgi:1,6-anhydro-N-acetylmuramate kinase